MQDEMHRTKSVISEMLIELIDRSVNRIWKHLSGGDALRGCLLYTSVGFQRQPGCWLRSSHTFKECVTAHWSLSLIHIIFKTGVLCGAAGG